MSWIDYLDGPFSKKNGTWTYILKKGAPLYHGTYSDVTPQDILSRPNFFGDLRTAKEYTKQCKKNAPKETPNLYEFILKKDIPLLAMDLCDTIRSLEMSSYWTKDSIKE